MVGKRYLGWERWARLALTVVLALYGWVCLRTPGTYRWLDDLDLAIHETGHLVFAFGGETLTLLGGTLFQLLVPIAFIVALWRQGDRHGATVPLWWLGQNCWNIAVYVKDARAQELPLVGRRGTRLGDPPGRVRLAAAGSGDRRRDLPAGSPAVPRRRRLRMVGSDQTTRWGRGVT